MRAGLTARVLNGSAIGLSGLCLAHCLALPLVAALLPVLGGWTGAEWVHVLLVALAAPIAALVFLRPARGGAPPWLRLMAAAGVALLAIGALDPGGWERPLTVAGSLTLASAHIMNWRRRRAINCASC
ncbi:MerC domain-containing protein [Phenylobacterium sp.]|uniref:MerC domain-containing protein n=1 Tax=Phenylobacterium sp. TaxID=1871053 RepID=UPI0037C75822